MRRNPVSKIFVSYRRDDSAGHTGHLGADLTRHFGAGQVFVDIEAIRPGEDFVKAMKRELDSCSVLVAVIGKDWLGISGGGARRLDNPKDYVRLEIATAFKRGISVIPVLVNGAVMPHEDDLPDDLKSLQHLNALEISDRRWAGDVRKLIEEIERELPQPSAFSNFGERLKSSQARLLIIGGAGIVVIFIAAVALWVRTGSVPPGNTNSPLTPAATPAPTTDSAPPVVTPTSTEVHGKQGRPNESPTPTPRATPTATPEVVQKDVPPWAWISDMARSLYSDGTNIETVIKVGDQQCTNGGCAQNVKVVLKDSAGRHRYEAVLVTYQRTNGSWRGTAKRLN